MLEEADESQFWLEFISDEKLMNPRDEFLVELIKEGGDLLSFFFTSGKTVQKKNLK